MGVLTVADTSHLLTFDEQQWIKDHPFDVRAVRVKKLCVKVVALEDALASARDELDMLVSSMDERMAK
jgi:hypothetical protein